MTNVLCSGANYFTRISTFTHRHQPFYRNFFSSFIHTFGRYDFRLDAKDKYLIAKLVATWHQYFWELFRKQFTRTTHTPKVTRTSLADERKHNCQHQILVNNKKVNIFFGCDTLSCVHDVHTDSPYCDENYCWKRQTMQWLRERNKPKLWNWFLCSWLIWFKGRKWLPSSTHRR